MIYLDDFKYALRLLAKKPGFTVLTTLVMAVGIGLSVYLFSFMSTMFFKDLPFVNGDTIVQFSAKRNGVREYGEISLHDYYEIRSNVKGLKEFGAFKNVTVNVSGRDGARRYSAKLAEPNIFQITRTKPILGREFTELENQSTSEHVVVIGYDVWQNQYAGHESVIDKIMRIDGESYRIIGVMPKSYSFPNDADLWMPLRQDAANIGRGEGHTINGLAHLDNTASLKEVNSQIDLVMQRLENRYPKTNKGLGAYAEFIPKTLVADGIAVVYAMQLVALLILTLASINVGNLLLARAIDRSKETAIRVALGAPRARLISQMLWESIIICTVGGIIGLLVLAWGLEVTQSVTASFVVGKPLFWWNFGIDAYALKMLIIFILGAIFITGFLPAWKNSGANFNAALRDGTRGALGKKSGRLNRFLVISEIFMSLAILIIAGVITIGTYKATFADVGANTENVLTARVLLNEVTYDTPEKKTVFIKGLQSRLEASPGIAKVMVATLLPGEHSSNKPTFAIEGKEYAEGGGTTYPRSNYISVVSGALEDLGVQLKDGRYFNQGDDESGKHTVIVTDSFVARNFKNENVLGRRIRLVEGEDKKEPEWLTIVGVVEHAVYGQANQEAGRTPTVFRPYAQAPQNYLTIAMKIKSDEVTATSTLRSALQSLDPDMPAFTVEPYQDSINRYNAPLRFISSIFLLFGIAAVVLAASGIYGVMSNTINQRTQEIGVKRALGAMEQRIIKEYLGKGLSQLLWGGTLGILVGSAMGFAMSTAMGVDHSDLLLIVITLATVVSGVVMMATYIPTLRVLKLEPCDALRHE